MANILLAVTGSISAYKAADLTSQLTKLGLGKDSYDSCSYSFYYPSNTSGPLKQAVLVEVMTEDDPKQIQHIDLGKEADLF